MDTKSLFIRDGEMKKTPQIIKPENKVKTSKKLEEEEIRRRGARP
jgi:hypothetical protein